MSAKKRKKSTASARRRRKSRARRRSSYLNGIATLMMIVLLAFAVRAFVVGAYTVAGESMAPTLVNGEVVLVNKIDRALGRPIQRDDIVLCHFEGTTGTLLKRVVGVGGDFIRVESGRATLVQGRTEIDLGRAGVLTTGEIPENAYLLVGDNLESSVDGRTYGLVTASALSGRVQAVIWPLSRLFHPLNRPSTARPVA